VRISFQSAHRHTRRKWRLAAAARRLGGRVEDEVPSLLAAVVIAALRAGMYRWEQGSDDHDVDSRVSYVERSVRVLHTLFA
jgi:hypothetical protein